MINASPSVLAVLVLYKSTPLTSQTFRTLCISLRETDLACRVKLLIYDNSPAPSFPPEDIPTEHSYVHDPQNRGLAAAYNAALDLAFKEGRDWLLLFDQDTTVTPSYLTLADRILREISEEHRIAAIVPKLESGGGIVSPSRVLWAGFLAPIRRSFSGVAPFQATALNSGTLIRVSAVRHIGGFNTHFWLDYLDHWMFDQLYRAGYSVYVMDIVIQHVLSVRNFATMTEVRYRNILRAESAYHRTCRSPIEQKVYVLRLLVRALKILLQARGLPFFRATMSHIVALLKHRN